MKNLPFWKMHGAGNDFILFDARTMAFPTYDKAWLKAIAARRTGIGCEGIILIQTSRKANFRMRFFNPDGSEVDMCGNGARCVARLAYEIKAAPKEMTIETLAGMLKAEILDNDVQLHMTEPKDWRMNRTLEVEGIKIQYSFVNTGVPHVVVEADDIESCDVQGWGTLIRHHSDFAPSGTNANFFSMLSADILKVRTFERGVEAETMACGTGIVATALIAARLGRVNPPVRVLAASGDVLTVDFRMKGESAEDVTLLGSAVHAFRGTIALSSE